MKKTLAELIDELSIVNVKIYMLVEKVIKREASMEDAEKIQTLNTQRAKIMNAISEEFNQEKRVKV